jgi:hypothetical protein
VNRLDGGNLGFADGPPAELGLKGVAGGGQPTHAAPDVLAKEQEPLRASRGVGKTTAPLLRENVVSEIAANDHVIPQGVDHVIPYLVLA